MKLLWGFPVAASSTLVAAVLYAVLWTLNLSHNLKKLLMDIVKCPCASTADTRLSSCSVRLKPSVCLCWCIVTCFCSFLCCCSWRVSPLLEEFYLISSHLICHWSFFSPVPWKADNCYVCWCLEYIIPLCALQLSDISAMWHNWDARLWRSVYQAAEWLSDM